MNDNEPDPGNGKNKDYAYAYCLIMITFVIITLSLAMIIGCMEAAGIVLHTNIRNWVGNDHIVIYTLRNINGRQFCAVEIMPVEEVQWDS